MVQMYATTAARSMLTGREQGGLLTDILAAKSLQVLPTMKNSVHLPASDGRFDRLAMIDV